MLEKRVKLVALGLTSAVFALRLFLANRARFCGTPDSCFYLGQAQSLERLHRFRVPFVFDLLLPHLTLPGTGLEYWRPGTSFFLLLAHPFGGVTLHAATAVATLAGVLWASAAWHMARRTSGSDRVAFAAYALALLLPPAWTGSLTPDSTLFYGAAVAWFLALFTVRRQGAWHDAIALLCASLAYLIRNDAALLAAPLLVVLVLRLRTAAPNRTEAGLGTPWGAASPRTAGWLLGGFALALLPMHLLYAGVLGTASPPGTAQTIFLRSLSDFNLYAAPPTARSLLNQGLAALLLQRLTTFALIVYRVLAVLLGYAALVFLPVSLTRRAGAWTPAPENPNSPNSPSSQRGEPRSAPAGAQEPLPELAGPITFGLTTLLVYSLLLPAIGEFSALRTATALLPWAAVLVMTGLRATARDSRLAALLTTTLLVLYTVSGLVEDRRDTAAMNAVGERDRALAVALTGLGARLESGLGAAVPGSQRRVDGGAAAEASPPTVVMIADPVQFSVTTGYAAVPLPGNGLGAALAEARELGVTHVILDTEHLPGQQSAGEAAVARSFRASETVSLPELHALLLHLSSGSDPKLDIDSNLASTFGSSRISERLQ